MTILSDPFPAIAEAPVLAHVVRGGFVESVHRAAVAAIDAEGAPLLSLGPVHTPVFPRSSNKPLQTVAMIRAGLDLPAHLVALASASHSGETIHRQGVVDILRTAGLTVDDLQNTPDWPVDALERDRRLLAGDVPSSLFQNCSGKHAAMLATCVLNDWPLESYRSPEHPVQRAIADTICEMTDEPIAAVAVDGCGAPVMAVTLTGLARAFGRLAAAPSDSPEGQVADAMRSHPEYVGGTGRDVTTLMAQTPGLIAKDGAESVYAVGLADGRALALKVVDGGARARPVLAAAALARLGVDSPAIAALLDAPVLGHGKPVGAVVAVGFHD